MAWPTPQDYNEAVQNPKYAFSDPELQTGTCELTALGLPKPITGNFASVYRLRCGGRDWAVRCFWRELTDMQQRYRAISAHLAAAGLPYTVGFEYQPQGIRVRGTWYPILKMEWVEGQLLNDYLIAHLHDPVALQVLQDRWLRMVTDLERSGCAHGDLQHGNVLIVHGELRLVDYDGMFVPALAGQGSHELGQQHYQHPRRGAGDFGPDLDRFSSWVIYLSILAVRLDPTLWLATAAGDERLLLQRQDFEEPVSSAALALLMAHTEPELRSLALEFRTAIDQPVGDVPSLTSILEPTVATGETEEFSAWRGSVRLKLWWRSVAPSAGVHGGAHPQPTTGTHPAWVIDYLPTPTDECVKTDARWVHAARMGVLATFPLSGVGGVGVVSVGAPIPVAAMVLLLTWGVASALVCLVAYRHIPAVRTLLPTVNRESQARRASAQCERAAEKFAARQDTMARRYAQHLAVAGVRTAKMDRQEKAELDVLVESFARKREAIDRRIHDVDRRESEDMQRALEAVQKRHIAETLRRTSLRGATIPGIGPAVKMRLWSLGIWTAADVSSERIRLMQHLRHEQLMEVVAWRVGAETVARRSMPRHVPSELQHAIRGRYGRERSELVAVLNRDGAAADATKNEVRQAFALRRRRIEGRLAQRLEEHTRTSAELEAKIILAREQQREHRHVLRDVRSETIASEFVNFRHFARNVLIDWSFSDRA